MALRILLLFLSINQILSGNIADQKKIKTVTFAEEYEVKIIDSDNKGASPRRKRRRSSFIGLPAQDPSEAETKVTSQDPETKALVESDKKISAAIISSGTDLLEPKSKRSSSDLNKNVLHEDDDEDHWMNPRRKRFKGVDVQANHEIASESNGSGEEEVIDDSYSEV